MRRACRRRIAPHAGRMNRHRVRIQVREGRTDDQARQSRRPFREAPSTSAFWQHSNQLTAAAPDRWRSERIRLDVERPAVWVLCRDRHKIHYADFRIVPRFSQVPLTIHGARAFDVGISEPFQVREQLIAWPIATGRCRDRLCPGHRSFLQLDVGMNIHLSTFDGFVPEPESDHGAVYAILEQLHRGAVAQHVRCHVLLLKCRASLGR
jgi:hypothetical protein